MTELKGWPQIIDIIRLLLDKADVVIGPSIVRINDKKYPVSHFVHAKVILKDLKKRWQEENIQQHVKLREYVEDAFKRGIR